MVLLLGSNDRGSSKVHWRRRRMRTNNITVIVIWDDRRLSVRRPLTLTKKESVNRKSRMSYRTERLPAQAPETRRDVEKAEDCLSCSALDNKNERRGTTRGSSQPGDNLRTNDALRFD
jgi:hypothetical protein